MWFELKNGSYIGVSAEGFIYGQREIAGEGLIDEEIRHNSKIVVANYPEGFELELNEVNAWARIQKNKYRFSSSGEVARFREAIRQQFPESETVINQVSIRKVAREPLWALVVLLVGVLLGMLLSPQSGNDSVRGGQWTALLMILVSIPKPLLIAGYLALSGIALYNVNRLWKQHQNTEFWLVKA